MSRKSSTPCIMVPLASLPQHEHHLETGYGVDSIVVAADTDAKTMNHKKNGGRRPKGGLRLSDDGTNVPDEDDVHQRGSCCADPRKKSLISLLTRKQHDGHSIDGTMPRCTKADANKLEAALGRARRPTEIALAAIRAVALACIDDGVSVDDACKDVQEWGLGGSRFGRDSPQQNSGVDVSDMRRNSTGRHRKSSTLNKENFSFGSVHASESDRKYSMESACDGDRKCSWISFGMEQQQHRREDPVPSLLHRGLRTRNSGNMVPSSPLQSLAPTVNVEDRGVESPRKSLICLQSNRRSTIDAVYDNSDYADSFHIDVSGVETQANATKHGDHGLTNADDFAGPFVDGCYDNAYGLRSFSNLADYHTYDICQPESDDEDDDLRHDGGHYAFRDNAYDAVVGADDVYDAVESQSDNKYNVGSSVTSSPSLTSQQLRKHDFSFLPSGFGTNAQTGTAGARGSLASVVSTATDGEGRNSVFSNVGSEDGLTEGALTKKTSAGKRRFCNRISLNPCLGGPMLSQISEETDAAPTKPGCPNVHSVVPNATDNRRGGGRSSVDTDRRRRWKHSIEGSTIILADRSSESDPEA